jgi:predicted nucleotidyltransferase
MPTPAQAALIGAIHRVLEADPRVEAAWLSGSFGRDAADDFSDVDVLVLVKAPWQDTAKAYADDVSAIADAALVNPLFGGAVLNVVTTDWERFDLSFISAENLWRYDGSGLKPLFNKVGAEPPVRPRTAYQPPPEKIAGMIREFLRVLGLAGVVLGREEHVAAVSGLELLRRAVIDLMIEDNRIAPEDRGGALHLRRLLTPEQHALLARFPPMRPERASVIECSVAAAGLFLPLARRLAEETGAQWPEALEQATRRRLKEALDVTF